MAAVRFTVTKSEEEEVPITDSPRVQDGYGSYVGGRLQTPPKGESVHCRCYILSEFKHNLTKNRQRC